MEAINEIAARAALKVIVKTPPRPSALSVNDKASCSLQFRRVYLSFIRPRTSALFGDAGAICTNDDEFAKTCRILRVHGSRLATRITT